MLSRLATVLQELSGEEGPDGDPQGMLVPQLPAGEDQAPVESEAPEEAMERLAHLEQLVVQLKELIRDKDTQLIQKDTELSNKDARLKNEKDEAEARFTKLKLQAKAKMASLNKQISELKGHGGATQSPDSSFTGAAVEEDLQELKNKLSAEEADRRALQERLQTTEQLLQEKESAHAAQLQKLQAVVCEKDVRFQEQIQKHEEELLRVTAPSQRDSELQQALHAAQRRCEELEEALSSRSQVLEMLQQEVSSADQQKQILTAQFRQMEQELANDAKQREEERQQWAEQASRAQAEVAALRTSLEDLERERTVVARQEGELASLREAEHASQEALGKEKIEVARLERQLSLMKEAELAAVQARHDALESARLEIVRLESELASTREAVVSASQEASERVKSEVDKLERELALSKEKHEEVQKKSEILGEIWRHLRSLTLEDVQAADEVPFPAEFSLFLDTVQSFEAQLTKLKDEHRESKEHCAELTHTMETLQEQLDRKTTEQEEATAKIQQLELQILLTSERGDMTGPDAQDLSEANEAHILQLEQQLLEKENELVALRESLRLAEEHSSSGVASCENYSQTPDQVQDASTAPHNSCAALPDFMDDTQEEDTTLVAQDTSVLSIPADSESSPELIGNQSESPEESKGTSSDEMVASSDSEVAHSSWTLLEAVNQDGGQEWPSILQEFGQLQLQSWEATSMEQETSTVQVESSSVIIRETVQVHLTQQTSSTTDGSVPSGQVFAQALAEELQKRYSELLAELQGLREAAAESQEKIKNLEEETQCLAAAKEKAESQANGFTEELNLAREELDKLSQQSSSVVEKRSVEMQLLEEQLDMLSTQNKTKEEKIQALQTELDMARQAFSEQEGQARMLSAQLEDRELLSSELEKRLQDMENSMLEYSQTSELNNDTLSKKDSEISELQLILSQKEQEVMELNDSMSAKLLQAEEEKFQIGSEVNKLKGQIVDLEKVRDEKQKGSSEDSAAHVGDELDSMRKEKGMLESQLTTTKKKLQAALVQRKDLMRKVAEFEVEAKKWKERDETAKTECPAEIPEVEQSRACELQEMAAKVIELEQALRSKDEAVETLEQKISWQDQVLSETLALNRKLREEAENSQQADSSSETTVLQSQVVSLEAECETLQKKVQEAQESRKETIRKAKEKDRHHREQLKQQKEEYSELVERFQVQSGEQEVLLTKLRALEEKVSTDRESCQETIQLAENVAKQAAGDWVQEDWVDFATSETDSSQPQSSDPVKHPAEQSDLLSAQMEASVKALRGEIQTVQMANTELEKQLQETEASLSLKEAELLELGKELQALREKERQIGALSEEINDLREKYHQAESYAETLKAEMDAAAQTESADSTFSITTLQAEVEDFKQFLVSKNHEILELSQQLSEQNSLIHSMQDTVTQKDQVIFSLQEELKAEQDKTQRLEVKLPLKQEEEKDSEAKNQQLQRKLQAALISRKEALKENKTQKEQLASTEKLLAELQQKMESAQDELEKLRAEKVRLIDEVDRTLLENQSLGSSCESLKLAMEGILNEKDACKREVEQAKEEAARTCREWEEKVQGMKDEYETLLKSYENVSDEAERVRRVLEAARQERQDLVAKVRMQEAAKQDAERRAEESQKEVDSVKDKMRKFAKTKQQKIMELEEENERLSEMQDKNVIKREDRALKAEVERLHNELGALKAELDATVAERDSLGQQIKELRGQLAQTGKKEDNVVHATVVEEVITAQQSHLIMDKPEPVEGQYEDKEEDTAADQIAAGHAPETHSQPIEEKEKAEMIESVQVLLEDKIREMEAAVDAERELWQEQEARLKAELASLEQDLQESREKEILEATLEAREVAEAAERRAQEMQARLDESLARLAAFSRCMSSLQDDRDRVLDETRQWETRFKDALQGKEAEVREAETRAKELAEQLQRESSLKEELQLSVDRLEKAIKDLQLKLEEEEKKVTESKAALEEERSNLRITTTELQSAQNEGHALKNEMESLIQRARALEEAVGHLQGEVDQARTELREREAEERRLCLNVEQLETDLRSSKALTETLQTELNEKEKREVEMLGEKEQAVTQAAEEARKEADSRAQEAEKELEQRRGEVRDLEEKLRKAEEESNNRKARLDSFMKAMGSLQDDRDRVLNMYKQLEEKHLQVIMEKDGLIQEAAGENNSLKEELRALLVQRDDLYAEKAQLSAQLHGYRNELNQVLSMKDSQHKQLLAAQRERIASLEKERDKLESQVKNVSRARETGVEEVRVESETLSQAVDIRTASQVIDAPGAEVEKLREQLQAAREQVEALEERRLKESQEQVSRSKELAELRWEGGVMRTESESAQERVAELARDLLAVEQNLLQEKEATAQLRAENHSFSKAMASLQDSRDQAESKVQELSRKLEEVSKAGGHAAHNSPGGSTGEVWGLKNALQALQNDRERLLEQLQTQASELKKQKLELARLGAGELIKISQELFEEKNKNEDILGVIMQLEKVVEMGKLEIETLRLERIDWMAQAEQLKQQTLATLSERDQQLRQLTAMLEEAHADKPKLQQEHYQREGTEEVDSAPGAPQERSSLVDSPAYVAEVKELQRRLDEEMQRRVVAEEQLMDTQDRLKRHSQAKWHTAQEEDHSETAVFIEPEGAVTRTRKGGPGLVRMLRVAFCSRQRTPLLFSLYLLTVHVLLLLCLGGYL
ncbi:golgin subfamily B member 1 isoform X2 [Etheostoma cragini]|uniref:golgin subfamily B member 1 isoform X2 n=1 Tax=Etheostoma cragini TaxID=417921 RepID=UPI00155E0D44|nr:golgin subfamily B member 1 isoform X2 [Etheostoma cragini]